MLSTESITFVKTFLMFDAIFKNFALHINLDASEVERISAVLQVRDVPKHTLLLEAGTTARNVYYVVSGCLRLFYTDENGDEHNISFSPENWWAVDITSFSMQKPAFMSIDALEDTTVCYLSYDAMEQLYQEVPKLERFFRILTQNGLYVYQRRTISNLSETAESRYKRFRKRYPDLELRITQKHIASYLGITPVFLSMLRKRT